VVVVGPEAVMVEVRRNGTVLAQVKAAPSQASPYQVAVLRNVPSARNGTQLVAIDTTGHVIDRAKFVTSY
jgi:hypothetical protein